MVKSYISQYNLKGLVKSVLFSENNIKTLTKVDPIGKNEYLKSLKESYHINTDNSIKEKGKLFNELIFNKDGFLECSKSYISSNYYEYDELNRIIECKNFIRNANKPNEIIKYYYNNNGLVNEIIVWNHTNSNNEFATELLYTDKGRFVSLLKFNYNSENLLFEVKEYWDDLKYKCIKNTRYKYDSQNNIIENLSYWVESNSVIIHEYYEYDANNLLIKKWWTDNSDIGIVDSHRSFSDYDDNKLIYSETVNWSNTNHTIILIFNYNSFNEPITLKIEVKKQGTIKETLKEIISYEYKYDSNNNWIDKKEFINGIQSNNICREIVYFD